MSGARGRWKYGISSELLGFSLTPMYKTVQNTEKITRRVASRLFLYLFTWLPPSDVHFRNIIPERSLNVGGCGVPLAGPGVCRLRTRRGSSYQAIGLFRISRAQARPIQPFPWWSAENRTAEIKRNARCWPAIGWNKSRDINTGLRLVGAELQPEQERRGQWVMDDNL